MPTTYPDWPSTKSGWVPFAWGGLAASVSLVCLYATTHWLFGLGPQWFDGLWQGWVAMAGGAVGQRIARRRRTAPGRC
ncbi:hypothetical protein GCM10022255_007180 [Dactylosporangium darangshiense]|uniref:Uncharacterized protein n=1 Tax=Dactylosporangium darangshiense TaxID=579108 RepID=A0ABP8CWY4_9ACTN